MDDSIDTLYSQHHSLIHCQALCACCRYGLCLERATWMLAGPQRMNFASFRSRILTTYTDSAHHDVGTVRTMPRPLKTLMHLGWIHITLDDVEDGDVNLNGWERLPLRNCQGQVAVEEEWISQMPQMPDLLPSNTSSCWTRYHDILGVKQPSHHV